MTDGKWYPRTTQPSYADDYFIVEAWNGKNYYVSRWDSEGMNAGVFKVYHPGYIEKLLGITIESKYKKVLKRCQHLCDKLNKKEKEKEFIKSQIKKFISNKVGDADD